jgi:hypothetical protein
MRSMFSPVSNDVFCLVLVKQSPELRSGAVGEPQGLRLLAQRPKLMGRESEFSAHCSNLSSSSKEMKLGDSSRMMALPVVYVP